MDEMEESEELCERKLHRTGDRPLVFVGTEIAVAESHGQGRDQKRWFTLALYRTRGGKTVAYRYFSTEWPRENDHGAAQAFDTLDAAVAWLRDWSPRRLIGIGYPPTMTEKNERLMENLETHYLSTLTELLGDTEAVERVE